MIRRAYDANVERVGGLLDAGVELLRCFAGVAAPAAVAAWTSAVRVPRSFSGTRMAAEFGPGEGPAWSWRSRARHVGRRFSVRVGRRGN